MGISNARDICQNLIAAGKDPQTPAAVCASVDITKPSGLLSTLEELPEKIETANIKSPGILVIGENAQFFKLPQKPLIAGIAGSGYFCKKIEKKIRKSMPDFAFECISVLDGIYENDPDQIKKALQEKPDWLVFTSVHGVKLLLKYLKEHNQDIRTLSGIKIACIGKQCAKPFVKAGIFADLISKTPTVAALADELLAQIKPDETIALLQSANGNPVLKKRLETKANVKVYPLYTLHYEKAENPEPCDYLAFGSSQAVIHFHTLYPSWTFSAIPFCLSQVSGSVFEKLYGFAPQLPKKISAASLAKAMIKQTHKQ
jgi:uroporphyrinogen III methyltransferase/synthase